MKVKYTFLFTKFIDKCVEHEVEYYKNVMNKYVTFWSKSNYS